VTEANRRRGPGTREKVSSRINLEGNTHAQEINASQLYPYLNQQKPLVLPIIAYTLSNKVRDEGKSFCLVVRGCRGRGRGKGGEMTLTLYAHMNKIKKERTTDVSSSSVFEWLIAHEAYHFTQTSLC
jgi:hypothetical protein